jgi:NADPH2:quinone reductase
LFDAITRGQVKVDIGLRAKLAYIARVHQMAEHRKTNGAILITP